MRDERAGSDVLLRLCVLVMVEDAVLDANKHDAVSFRATILDQLNAVKKAIRRRIISDKKL